MDIQEIARSIKEARENIFLIYAFNGTGKTRLSKEYKDITKDADGRHDGVYYNAFSEDLFRWNNDEENDNDRIRLEVVKSSLSPLHQYFGDENPIKEKLKRYQPQYDFRFKYLNDNPEDGIEYVWFFNPENQNEWIKISRGEERIFIWCFFLALFNLDDFADAHKNYIFIDDPVSSMDDMNIYLTAQTIFELFEQCITRNNADGRNRKIIVSTHHIGLFSILIDWLKKGENANLFKDRLIQHQKIEENGEQVIRETVKESNRYLVKILEKKGEDYELRSQNSGAWLYHLLLLQKLKKAVDADELYLYHFGMLRQVLETIASFLGEGRFGFVLHEINEPDDTADKINTFSHRRIYDVENAKLTADNKDTFVRILNTIISKYNFKI